MKKFLLAISLCLVLQAGWAFAAQTNFDNQFLAEVRKVCISGKPIPEDNGTLFSLIKPPGFQKLFTQTSFPQNAYGFTITLYEPGAKSYKAISTKRSSYGDIVSAVNALIANPKFKNFHPADAEKCRIQIDFILDQPEEAKFETFSQSKLGKERFELGVDGLLAEHLDKKYYFLPGDAFVKSVLYLDQLKRIMRKGLPDKPALKDIKFYRFRTKSYVSFRDRWIELYRGYPVLGAVTKDQVSQAAQAGIQYLLRTQKEDGRFLYYYEASQDSYKDFEHPSRDPGEDPYYNELRHAGGVLLLLDDYRLTKDEKALSAAKKAIEWLMKIKVDYKLPDGTDAAYFYLNKKSKLGGAGLGLCVLSEYQDITGDTRYEKETQKLVRHLVSQLTKTGEFYYYNIYLDKPVPEADNAKYFSFYYPGEALIGLASYYKHVVKDAGEKELLREKMKLALKFLIEIRPVTHKDKYAPLPSDAWLMMAVNKLWDVPEMREESYKKFVFGDADAMIAHMYNEKNALYPDYKGSFYYIYGDFPFPDGARCEGLVAALDLATKIGDKEKAGQYLNAIKKTVWATLHLCNTPESVYSVPVPEKTIGGIRFKTTRQWFRVDTIAHVASYYIRFLPYLEDTKSAS